MFVIQAVVSIGRFRAIHVVLVFVVKIQILLHYKTFCLHHFSL